MRDTVDSSGGLRRHHVVVVLTVAAVVVAACQMALFQAPGGQPWFYAAVVAWTLVAVIVTVPLAMVTRWKADLFAPTTWVFGLGFLEFVFRGGLLLASPANFRFPQLLDDSGYYRSLAMALFSGAIAYTAFAIGYYTFRRSGVRLRVPTRAETRLLAKVALVLLAASYVGYIMFVESLGGLSVLIGSLYQRNELLEGRHYEVALIRLAYVAPMLLLVAQIGARSQQRWARISLILVVVGCVLMATLGGRGRALAPALGLLMMWHYFVRRMGLRHLAVVSIVLIVAANAILLVRQESRRASSVEELQTSVLEQYRDADLGEQLTIFATARVPFQGLDGLMVLQERMPKELPFQWSLPLKAIVVFVPRALWPGKPAANPGSIFSTTWLPANESAKSTGSVGTAFMMYGYLGIVVLFALNGRILAWLYNTFRNNLRQPLVAVGYLLILTTARDVLIPPYENLLIHTVPLLAVGMLFVLLRGQRAPVPARPSAMAREGRTS